MGDDMESNAKVLVNNILTGIVEISGARGGEDNSVYVGIGYLKDIPVTFIAQIREYELQKCVETNFSMTTPTGYRKVMRAAMQAERFKRPILIFVDTIGADASEKSESEGQAFRIAECMYEFMKIKTPIISVLCGQGGSGGALALCIADRLLATREGHLGVASIKACKSILGKKYDDYLSSEIYFNAQQLEKIGVVGRILDKEIEEEIYKEMNILRKKKMFFLKQKRIKKYRRLGGIL